MHFCSKFGIWSYNKIASGQDARSTEDNTLNEPSMMEGHFRKDACIRCDKVGELLVCSELDCPIAIHGRCMASQPMFDEEGRFYCPYCSYKRALALLSDLSRNVMMTQKALSDFIDTLGGLNILEKINALKKKASDISTSGVDTNLFDHGGHMSNATLRNHDVKVELNHINEGYHAVKETDVNDVYHKKEQEQKNIKLSKETLEDGDDDIELSKEWMLLNVNVRSGNEDLDNETSVKMMLPKSEPCLNLQNAEFLRKLPPIKGPEPWKTGVTEIERISTSDAFLIQQQGSPNQNRPLFLSGIKRKRSIWTADEEEMLREGVNRFSAMANKNLPWKKILYYGRHVFADSRGPADLKDKWRKMMAKEASKSG